MTLVSSRAARSMRIIIFFIVNPSFLYFVWRVSKGIDFNRHYKVSKFDRNCVNSRIVIFSEKEIVC